MQKVRPLALPKKPTQKPRKAAKKPWHPLAGAIHHPLEEQAVGPFYRAVLPLAPGVNASYGLGRIRQKNKITGGVSTYHRMIGTPELHAFKDEAQKTLSKVQLSSFEKDIINWLVEHKKDKRKVPLSLSIVAFYPTLWKSDEDKIVKVVQDVVFAAINLDDKVVCDLIVKKRVSDTPRIEIELSLLVDWEVEGEA